MTQAGAPDGGWVRQLTTVKSSSVPVDRIVLGAVGITAPVGIALTIDASNTTLVGAGSLASMGAFVGSIMDQGDAGIERIRRIFLASALATVGFAIGTLVHGHGVLTLIAVVLASLVSGLAGTFSATASRSALYFLVYVVTAANASFGLDSPWAAPLIFAAGAGWRLLLTIVAAAFIGRSFSPERRAVAGAYRAIADQLAAEDGQAGAAASAALTRALNNAYEVLADARTSYIARAVKWQALVSLLNASAPVVDAAIAASSAHPGRVDTRAVVFLRATAAWIDDPRRSVPASYDGTDETTPADRALAGALRYVSSVVAENDLARHGRVARGRDAGLSVPTASGRGERPLTALDAGTQAWGAVARLVLCIGIAQALSLWLGLAMPYLVMLTVAQSMKPDLGSVFARAVQRGSGTILGVFIGSVVMFAVPRDGWQLLILAVLAGLLPVLMPRNFALFSATSTAVAVLLVEIHAGASVGLVETRLLDTLLGCAVALVFGYLLWPSTWRAPAQLGTSVARVLREASEYAGLALSTDDTRRRVDARRAVNRMISDLRALVTRSLAEPRPVSAAAAAWMPGITALERVVDAVTAAATIAAQTGTPCDPAEVALIRSALDELSAAAAAGRAPASLTVPDTGPLADVGDEITTARSALAAGIRAAHTRAAAAADRES